MSSPSSLSPWYRALALQERVALAGPAPPAAPAGDEAALWRLRRWRRQPPFDRPELFAERLATAGLDEASFLAWLSTDPESFASDAAEPPPWLGRLERSLAEPPQVSTAPHEPGWELTVTQRCVRIFRPLTEPACRRLAREAQAIAQGPSPIFDAEWIVSAFWPSAEGRLMTMAGRALVLELHVAREEGRLGGATPEERFQSFLDRLAAPEEFQAFLAEYCVLARQIQLALDNWVDAALELLTRLVADAERLAERFCPGTSLGMLSELDAGAGDLHRGGRSVILARFSSGVSLVYKPRSMAVDVRFQALVEWLNGVSTLPPLRTLKVLDRGDYGWCELVANAPCDRRDAVERFHLRLGALLALFYLLEATDLHYENLIAAGEHPVAIDLETLFHPRPRVAPHAQRDLDLLSEHVVASVLRVGLLPFQVGAAGDDAGLDASGLAIVEGELSPSKVLTWENPGTDQMRAVRRRLPLPGAANRPRLDEREVEAVDYLAEIVEGFQIAYRCLARHREELRAPGGLLDRFAGAPLRAVLRATRTYHLLWFESFHPDMLRDGLDRDFLLDRLWVGAADLPHLRQLLPFERRDLDTGDIPVFAALPDSADLYTSSGETLSGYFPEPPLEIVRRKLAALSEADLRRQLALLRASLSTRLFRREAVVWPSYRAAPSRGATSLERLRPDLLRQAERIGERLQGLALRKAGHATWISVEFQAARWSLTSLPEDLYSGLPGLALFLGHLGALTEHEEWTLLAHEAVASLLDRVRHRAADIPSIGAFQGWGGIVYAVQQLATLWRDDALDGRLAELLERIPPLLAADRDLDLIGGAAGCIASLLPLRHGPHARRALEIAGHCGDRLLDAAEPAGSGVGWKNRIAASAPQTGFSHGAAGYAWSLWRLAEATGEGRFRDAALAGFCYEHGCYDAKEGNWLDVGDPDTAGRPRQGGERSNCMAWCYGAPGVALSRLATLGGSAEPFLRQDLDRALQATRERGFGFNHSLCHGDLGNLDILLLAARRLGDPALEMEVARRADEVLESLERLGPLCGTPQGIESPGLMNGFAGIGYGLLRLAFPERVPSVLALEGLP